MGPVGSLGSAGESFLSSGLALVLAVDQNGLMLPAQEGVFGGVKGLSGMSGTLPPGLLGWPVLP